MSRQAKLDIIMKKIILIFAVASIIGCSVGVVLLSLKMYLQLPITDEMFFKYAIFPWSATTILLAMSIVMLIAWSWLD